jgi:hypothetical protein
MKGFIDGLGAHSQSMLNVGSTIARQSLGVHTIDSFKEGVHRKADKYWDEIQGEWRAKDQVKWYIYKVCVNTNHSFLSSQLLTVRFRDKISQSRIPSYITFTDALPANPTL